MGNQSPHREEQPQTNRVAIGGPKEDIKHDGRSTHKDKQQAKGNYLDATLGIAAQNFRDWIDHPGYHIKSSGIT